MHVVSKEKQIEEMAKDIERTGMLESFSRCEVVAYDLYEDGYHKQSEGHWFIREYEYFTCSECGDDYPSGCDTTAEAKRRLKNGEYPNYCPNCGVKMKEGVNYANA